MKNKNKLAVIIALTSLGLSQTSASLLSPCLAEIYASFPEAGSFVQSYIVTGTFFVTIPFIFITGRLAEKISKKKLLITGLVIYLVGVVAENFASSLNAFALWRTVLAIGSSIVNLLTFSIMFENFPDSNESSGVMGAYQACMTLIMAVSPMIAGFVCRTSWRAAQMINLIGIVPLALVFIFVPDVKPSALKSKEQEELHSEIKEKTDIPRLVLTLLETSFVIIFGFLAVYYISIYIAERNLGDSAVAGLVASVMTVIGFFLNLFYGKLYKALQRYIGVAFAILSGISMILLGFDVPLSAVYILCAFIGLGCAAKSSSYPILVNEYAATNKLTTCQSIYTVVMYLASSVCGYVPNFLSEITGGSMQKTFLYSGIILTMYCLLETVIIKSYIDKKKA